MAGLFYDLSPFRAAEYGYILLSTMNTTKIRTREEINYKLLIQKNAREWRISFGRYKYLYLLLVPALAYYLIFHYVPLYGLTLAFKKYKISKGILGSDWSDPFLHYFIRLFKNPDFYRAVKNTFIISFYKIIFAFPAPIILALALNEVRSMGFRKITQTLMYLPHFISWVVIGGIMIAMLRADEGIINIALGWFGVPSRQYMTDPTYFRAVLVISHIWKNMGWGAIIYFAALAGVDPNLYEAAIIDGAKRGQLLWHITLPSIKSTIIIMLILNLGRVMNVGFEQVFLLYSLSVYEVSDIIQTFVYRAGIQGMQYSLATAAGLFRSAISLLFIISSNTIAKKMGERGIY
jgi:putative aldouronate transport system permease protein